MCQVKEDLRPRLGSNSRRYWPMVHELRPMGERAFEERSAERGPDETLGDGAVLRLQRVEVGVGFPILEDELELPTEPIEALDVGPGEALFGQIREQMEPTAARR